MLPTKIQVGEFGIFADSPSPFLPQLSRVISIGRKYRKTDLIQVCYITYIARSYFHNDVKNCDVLRFNLLKPFLFPSNFATCESHCSIAFFTFFSPRRKSHKCFLVRPLKVHLSINYTLISCFKSSRNIPL